MQCREILSAAWRYRRAARLADDPCLRDIGQYTVKRVPDWHGRAVTARLGGAAGFVCTGPAVRPIVALCLRRTAKARQLHPCSDLRPPRMRVCVVLLALCATARAPSC